MSGIDGRKKKKKLYVASTLTSYFRSIRVAAGGKKLRACSLFSGGEKSEGGANRIILRCSGNQNRSFFCVAEGKERLDLGLMGVWTSFDASESHNQERDVSGE